MYKNVKDAKKPRKSIKNTFFSLYNKIGNRLEVQKK